MATLATILRALGFIINGLSAICLWSWYVDWLDLHFMWWIIAVFIGFVTIPLIPIAVLLEWPWHGWPHEVTFWLVGIVIGMALMAASYRILKD